jgi:transposase
MVAVGIDVSKNRSTVAAIGDDKKVLAKPFDISHKKADLAELVTFVQKLQNVRVVMEHTGVYYQIVAETLVNSGVNVSVVNPVLINQFGNNTLRKVKTDKRDSMKIARYALENHHELRDYGVTDSQRDTLKSFVRQFNFEDKNLSAQKNRLYALLQRTFPFIDEFFSSPAKSNGHQKLIDFVITFWHNDCVSSLSLAKFTEKYRKFCKKNHYCFKEKDATEIHAISMENLTSMPKSEATKMLVCEAAKHVLTISERVEKLRSEMIALAKELPEFEIVAQFYGVGECLATKLIGEIGDVRRFASKHSLVAYAGIDPDRDESGRKVSKSGKISRSGDALIRKFAYQVVECHLLCRPADEPVYQFLDKKRSEGKHHYVCMTAACNKFLRIYYGRVKEFLDSLETQKEPQVETTATVSASENEQKIPSKRIILCNPVKTNIAFTCQQDRATVETDLSGCQGFAKQKRVAPKNRSS